MAYGRIGTRGTNPGPPKTAIRGTKWNPGNLGRSTSEKSNAGLNHDAVKGIQKARVNPGPGGSQRP